MNEDPRNESTVSDELSRMGRQVAEAMRLMWESEDRKRLQADIADGMRKFGEQVDEAVRQAQHSDTTRQISEQAQKVATKMQETRVVDDVRDGLVTGLASLNRELSRLLDHLAERTVPAQPGAPGVAAVEPTASADAPAGPSDPAI